MNNGFIVLHRKILGWEWYSNINVTRLFIHLLLRANHEDGKWQGTDIHRGQLITGRLQLSKETGLSQQTLRSCITKLKSTSEITVKSTNKFSLITVVNYDVYQSKATSKATSKPLNEQPTINQQLTTNNKNNNENKKEQDNNIDTVSLKERTYLGRDAITKSVLLDISQRYDVTEEFVADCWDTAQNWLDAHGKVQKDYKAFLSNWVKRTKADYLLKVGSKRGGVIYAGDKKQIR